MTNNQKRKMEKKKKHVRFHNIVYVVLIPTRHEYAAFKKKLWY
jgi:hypothetical protein